jgi:5'-nucleotidase/2',3'-cyclic phosphodiesterase and related esterases
MSISRRRFCHAALLGGLTAPFIKGHSLFADTTAEPVKQSTVLTLLHTNDPHGRVYLPEEAYGLTRVATLVRQIRQEMPNVLLLDAGDLIHGTPEERAFCRPADDRGYERPAIRCCHRW